MANQLPKRKKKSTEKKSRSITRETTDNYSIAGQTVITNTGNVFEHHGGSIPVLPQSQRFRRFLIWSSVLLILLLVSIPVGLWMNYQADHIMSRNAMVRGNLSEIGTGLNGVLASVDVIEGESVTSGQILFRLKDRQLQSLADEERAELSSLEKELEVALSDIELNQRLLQNKLREAKANLNAAAAEVAVASSQAEEAENYFQVRQKLLSSNAISREDVRNADTKRRTALAQKNVAEANYAAANSAKTTAYLETQSLDIRQQRIGILEANIAKAKARISGAEADIESTVIRAPADGAIIRIFIQPGGSVKVGKPVMSMSIGSDIWIEAWIDENEISDVAIGDIATVTLQSFPGSEFEGVIDKIGLTTDFEMPESDIPQPRNKRMRGWGISDSVISWQ